MAIADETELLLLRLLDEEYTRHPSPKAPTVGLRQPENSGLATLPRALREPQACAAADTHRAQVRILGLVAMAPSPNTSKKHPQNAIYPYLLRGLSVVRPNPVWSTDITYIRLAQGFVYLVAIIDWYSRTNSRRFRRSLGLAGVEHDGRQFLCGLPGRCPQGV